MKNFLIFMSIRALDLLSTYLVMAKYGGWADVEGNPFYSYIMKNSNFAVLSLINIIISLFIYMLVIKIKIAYKIITVGMFLVVIWNFGTFFLI